jgi:CspA family cold shock protein
VAIQLINHHYKFFRMKTGTIKFFNATKGYGFIKDDETGNEVFLHITGLIDQPINTGDHVSYDVQDGKKGLNAINVKKI